MGGCSCLQLTSKKLAVYYLEFEKLTSYQAGIFGEIAPSLENFVGVECVTI